MQNNDRQYYIYIRSTRQRAPCTKEQFDNYYRDIDLFRQRQEYRKQCVCPKHKRLDCDTDCITCPFYRPSIFSLDDTKKDDDGEKTARIYDLADTSTPIDEIVTDTIELERLFKRLKEIMPQAIEIGRLRQQGLTEDAIAAQIGIGRKTYAYRLKKAAEMLKKEFPDFF